MKGHLADLSSRVKAGNCVYHSLQQRTPRGDGAVNIWILFSWIEHAYPQVFWAASAIEIHQTLYHIHLNLFTYFSSTSTLRRLGENISDSTPFPGRKQYYQPYLGRNDINIDMKWCMPVINQYYTASPQELHQYGVQAWVSGFVTMSEPSAIFSI